MKNFVFLIIMFAVIFVSANPSDAQSQTSNDHCEYSPPDFQKPTLSVDSVFVFTNVVSDSIPIFYNDYTSCTLVESSAFLQNKYMLARRYPYSMSDSYYSFIKSRYNKIKYDTGYRKVFSKSSGGLYRLC